MKKINFESKKNRPLNIGMFYKHIDDDGGYPRDVLRLYDELSNLDINVLKLKTINDFLKVRSKLDIVHLFGVFRLDLLILQLLCKFFKIPYIVTTFSHLMPFALANKSLKKKFYLSLIGKYLLNGAWKIHAFTECEKRELNSLGITSPIEKIPLGIYPEDLKLEEASIQLNGEYEEGPYIIFLGRLDIYQKGIDILIEGFDKYAQIKTKYKLIICGQDWNGGDAFIREKLSSLNSQGRIIFLGEVSNEEKNVLIGKAEAFIYASRFDGPPRPLRFALSLNQKILVSFQSNLADNVEEHGWGLQFNADSESISRKIIEFEEYANWPEYEDPAEILSWKNIAADFNSMYQS